MRLIARAGVMMGMLQLPMLAQQDADIKAAVDAIKSAMLNGKVEELRDSLPALEARLKPK